MHRRLDEVQEVIEASCQFLATVASQVGLKVWGIRSTLNTTTNGGDNMKHIDRPLLTLAALVASFGLLAACGSSDDDAASPSTLAFEATTTTASETSGASDPATDETDESAPAAPELTAEMFESMLETENGRALLVGSIAAETGLDTDAADCLLDAIPLETLVEAAGSFLGGEGEGGLFPVDQMAEVAPVLESCGIAPDALRP